MQQKNSKIDRFVYTILCSFQRLHIRIAMVILPIWNWKLPKIARNQIIRDRQSNVNHGYVLQNNSIHTLHAKIAHDKMLKCACVWKNIVFLLVASIRVSRDKYYSQIVWALCFSMRRQTWTTNRMWSNQRNTYTHIHTATSQKQNNKEKPVHHGCVHSTRCLLILVCMGVIEKR